MLRRKEKRLPITSPDAQPLDLVAKSGRVDEIDDFRRCSSDGAENSTATSDSWQRTTCAGMMPKPGISRSIDAPGTTGPTWPSRAVLSPRYRGACKGNRRLHRPARKIRADARGSLTSARAGHLEGDRRGQREDDDIDQRRKLGDDQACSTPSSRSGEIQSTTIPLRVWRPAGSRRPGRSDRRSWRHCCSPWELPGMVPQRA